MWVRASPIRPISVTRPSPGTVAAGTAVLRARIGEALGQPGDLVGEATEHEEAEHRQDHRREQRHLGVRAGEHPRCAAPAAPRQRQHRHQREDDRGRAHSPTVVLNDRIIGPSPRGDSSITSPWPQPSAALRARAHVLAQDGVGVRVHDARARGVKHALAYSHRHAGVGAEIRTQPARSPCSATG